MKLRILIIAFALFNVTGCGFQLMKANSIKETYPQIVLIGDNNDILYKELEKNLIINGVDVIKGTGDFKQYLEQDTPVISCAPLKNKESTMSVGSNSQAIEFNYRSLINCRLFEKGKKPYSIKSAINRSYLNKAGSTIASDSEKNNIEMESAKILCEQILFRLQNSYLIPDREMKKPANKPTEKIKVVFNATAEDETTQEIIVTSPEDLKALPGLMPEDATPSLDPK